MTLDSDYADRFLVGQPDLLTLDEAAGLLRMTRTAYLTAIKENRAPGHRYPAGGWRVFREELADYLREEWVPAGKRARDRGDEDSVSQSVRPENDA